MTRAKTDTKVLQFSGGIDSLACLMLLKGEWPRLHVHWCNTGDAYPETVALMREIAKEVPHFREVRSDKMQWQLDRGIAVDLLPIRASTLGHMIHGTSGTKFSPAYACCRENIWEPLARAARHVGATTIVRGQRADEERKGPIEDGHHEGGVIYSFPLAKWTRADVLAYCDRECPRWVPQYYARGERSSHDCKHCIAYLDDNIQRLRHLEGPSRELVEAMLEAYEDAIARDTDVLTMVQEALHARV